jgi:hypothetical protein
MATLVVDGVGPCLPRHNHRAGPSSPPVKMAWHLESEQDREHIPNFPATPELTVLDRLRTCLKESRRQRLEREAADMADVIQRAYFCRCMSRFIDSVLSYRERRGYVTEQQHRKLRLAVMRLERGL